MWCEGADSIPWDAEGPGQSLRVRAVVGQGSVVARCSRGGGSCWQWDERPELGLGAAGGGVGEGKDQDRVTITGLEAVGVAGSMSRDARAVALMPVSVSPGEEEDLPACPPACPTPGREVLTMKRTLLQLILAASACLLLDGNLQQVSHPQEFWVALCPQSAFHTVTEYPELKGTHKSH